jgi:large subunit ribosomal protein L30
MPDKAKSTKRPKRTTSKKASAATAKTTTKKAAKKATKKTVKKATKAAKTAKAATPPSDAVSTATVRVRQVRSGIGHAKTYRRTLRALGLKHHQDSVVLPDNASIRGMLFKVRHLVQVTSEEA